MQIRVDYTDKSSELTNITYAEWQAMYRTLELRGKKVVAVIVKGENGKPDFPISFVV